jgi:two-component system response regulator
MDAKTILVVEDNPDDEELTLRSLRRAHIANKVIVARDGGEALDYLYASGEYAGRDATQIPALVLLDLKLPIVGGIDILKRIRAEPATRYLPVVIMTSSSEDEDMVKSYDSGANSYIRKPVDFSEFAGAVQQLGLYWLVLNSVPKLV